MRRRLCIRFQYWESPVATACKEEKPKAEKPIYTCSIFGKTRTRIYQFCSQRERNFVCSWIVGLTILGKCCSWLKADAARRTSALVTEWSQKTGPLCKPLSCCKIRQIRRLKRLASAVQLRPWPPYSKASITFSILHTFDVGGPKNVAVDVGPTNLDQIVNEIQIGTGAIAEAGRG